MASITAFHDSQNGFRSILDRSKTSMSYRFIPYCSLPVPTSSGTSVIALSLSQLVLINNLASLSVSGLALFQNTSRISLARLS